MAIGEISSTVSSRVVAGHHHLLALGQRHGGRDVGGPEVELRPVAGEERRVAAALFLGQRVDGALELLVRGDASRASRGPGRARPRPSRRRAAGSPMLSPAWPSSRSLLNISTPVTTVLRVSLMPTISHLVADVHDAAADASRDDRAAARDGEHVLDRHQERLVDGARRNREVLVHRLEQLIDALGLLRDRRGAPWRCEGRALDDRDLVAGELRRTSARRGSRSRPARSGRDRRPCRPCSGTR